MTEFYTKASADFAKQQKEAKALLTDYGRIINNAKHHKNMVIEACDEVSRVIQKLKDGGQTGATIGDFDDDKDVKANLKFIDEATTKCDALAKELGKVVASTKMCSADMEDLAKSCDKEVTERTKKKDRKVLPTDSKTLPQIEKLATEARKQQRDLRNEILETYEVEFEGDSKTFKRLLDTAVKNTKDTAARDKKAMGIRSMDMRVFQKHRNETLSACTSISKGNEAAENAFKAGKVADAKKQAESSVEAMKGVMATVRHYTELKKGMNPYDLKTMQDSKDGKVILQGIEEMQKASFEAGKGLKAIIEKIKAAKSPA